MRRAEWQNCLDALFSSPAGLFSGSDAPNGGPGAGHRSLQRHHGSLAGGVHVARHALRWSVRYSTLDSANQLPHLIRPVAVSNSKTGRPPYCLVSAPPIPRYPEYEPGTS